MTDLTRRRTPVLLWAMPTTSTRLLAGTPSMAGLGMELDSQRSSRPLTPVLALAWVLLGARLLLEPMRHEGCARWAGGSRASSASSMVGTWPFT